MLSGAMAGSQSVSHGSDGPSRTSPLFSSFLQFNRGSMRNLLGALLLSRPRGE